MNLEDLIAQLEEISDSRSRARELSYKNQCSLSRKLKKYRLEYEERYGEKYSISAVARELNVDEEALMRYENLSLGDPDFLTYTQIKVYASLFDLVLNCSLKDVSSIEVNNKINNNKINLQSAFHDIIKNYDDTLDEIPPEKKNRNKLNKSTDKIKEIEDA